MSDHVTEDVKAKVNGIRDTIGAFVEALDAEDGRKNQIDSSDNSHNHNNVLATD